MHRTVLHPGRLNDLDDLLRYVVERRDPSPRLQLQLFLIHFEFHDVFSFFMVPFLFSIGVRRYLHGERAARPDAAPRSKPSGRISIISFFPVLDNIADRHHFENHVFLGKDFRFFCFFRSSAVFFERSGGDPGDFFPESPLTVPSFFSPDAPAPKTAKPALRDGFRILFEKNITEFLVLFPKRTCFSEWCLSAKLSSAKKKYIIK